MGAKVMVKFLKQGLILMLGVLLWMPPGLYAYERTISWDEITCPTNIWDMTGTYDEEVPEFPTCNLTYTLAQDAKGKITSSGNAACSVYEQGVHIDLDFDFDIKGSIKQRNGIATAKLSLKLKGTAHVYDNYEDYGSLKFSGSEKITAEVDTIDNTIEGTVKMKVCVQKAGCASGTASYYDVLPVGMDGTWTLNVEASDDPKKMVGVSTLTLANDRPIVLSVKGKYNTKKDEIKFTLKGEDEFKGCKLAPKIDESTGDILSIKGKVLGQKIMCK